MLDISIKNVKDVLNSEKKYEQLLNDKLIIEQKVDGLKLTLIKVKDTGSIEDWIVSYKNQVFYPEEFSYSKGKSIGNSQFQAVFKHLESFKPNVPLNVEFFCEFTANKDTLMSNYSKVGEMILIGYGKCNPQIEFGKLKTNSQGFENDRKQRSSFAKQLGIREPVVLYNGFINFENLKNSNLKEIKDSLTILDALKTNPESYVKKFFNILLSVESPYGGTEEGIVVYSSKLPLFKVQQEYQLDKLQRQQKKAIFKDPDPEKENQYWNNIKLIAYELLDHLSKDPKDLQDSLKQLAKLIASKPKKDLVKLHSIKTVPMILDDIQVNAKNLLLKSLEGNNNSLVLGKFRILTNGHVKMIKTALKNSDDVVIGLVTGKDTKDTEALRYEMLSKTFPDLTIIKLSSGNLFTAFKKADKNINTVYCGSDRVESYSNFLKFTMGTIVKEIERTSNDISATKVIENLNDFKYFKANTPKEIHSLYAELVKVYNG